VENIPEDSGLQSYTTLNSSSTVACINDAASLLRNSHCTAAYFVVAAQPWVNALKQVTTLPQFSSTHHVWSSFYLIHSHVTYGAVLSFEGTKTNKTKKAGLLVIIQALFRRYLIQILARTSAF
jgi:hypothetical protein